jgi:hypothetical protein
MKAPGVLGAGEHCLGEYGLVELDQRDPGREQEVELLPQHPHDVLGQLLAGPVDAIPDAREPHQACEQVRPGERDLYRPVREGVRERVLVAGQRTASAERTEEAGMADFGRRHVQRAHLLFELLWILDERQEIGERDEMAVVEPPAHEARVVVAMLLTVRDDVDAGAPRDARGWPGASSADAASSRCPSPPARGPTAPARAAAAPGAS